MIEQLPIYKKCIKKQYIMKYFLEIVMNEHKKQNIIMKIRWVTLSVQQMCTTYDKSNFPILL